MEQRIKGNRYLIRKHVKTHVQTVSNKMDVHIVNTRSHLSINKCISKSGDLKLARRDGKWENGLIHSETLGCGNSSDITATKVEEFSRK